MTNTSQTTVVILCTQPASLTKPQRTGPASAAGMANSTLSRVLSNIFCFVWIKNVIGWKLLPLTTVDLKIDTRFFSVKRSLLEMCSISDSPRLRVVGGVILKNKCVFVAKRPNEKVLNDIIFLIYQIKFHLAEIRRILGIPWRQSRTRRKRRSCIGKRVDGGALCYCESGAARCKWPRWQGSNPQTRLIFQKCIS